MKYHHIWIKEDHAYVLPVGDLHFGAENFNEKKLQGYLRWVDDHTDNTIVPLMGDIINSATLTSKSSLYEESIHGDRQVDGVLDILMPHRRNIKCSVLGNHEDRIWKYSGHDVCRAYSEKLGIEYLGISGVLFVSVGVRSNRNSPVSTYAIYLAHTTGGGSTPGGKMNRIDKLRLIVDGCDIYAGGHSHGLGVFKGAIEEADLVQHKVRLRPVYLVNTGSCLDYEGYAEKMQLPPSHTGFARIRLSGNDKNHKDVHISL
jgi:hypothetical protein